MHDMFLENPYTLHMLCNTYIAMHNPYHILPIFIQLNFRISGYDDISRSEDRGDLPNWECVLLSTGPASAKSSSHYEQQHCLWRRRWYRHRDKLLPAVLCRMDQEPHLDTQKMVPLQLGGGGRHHPARWLLLRDYFRDRQVGRNHRGDVQHEI